MKEGILSLVIAILVYNVVWYAYGCQNDFSLLIAVISFWGSCITAFLWQIYRSMKKKQHDTESQDVKR